MPHHDSAWILLHFGTGSLEDRLRMPNFTRYLKECLSPKSFWPNFSHVNYSPWATHTQSQKRLPGTPVHRRSKIPLIGLFIGSLVLVSGVVGCGPEHTFHSPPRVDDYKDPGHTGSLNEDGIPYTANGDPKIQTYKEQVVRDPENLTESEKQNVQLAQSIKDVDLTMFNQSGKRTQTEPTTFRLKIRLKESFIEKTLVFEGAFRAVGQHLILEQQEATGRTFSVAGNCPTAGCGQDLELTLTQFSDYDLRDSKGFAKLHLRGYWAKLTPHAKNNAQLSDMSRARLDKIKNKSKAWVSNWVVPFGPSFYKVDVYEVSHSTAKIEPSLEYSYSLSGEAVETNDHEIKAHVQKTSKSKDAPKDAYLIGDAEIDDKKMFRIILEDSKTKEVAPNDASSSTEKVTSNTNQASPGTSDKSAKQKESPASDSDPNQQTSEDKTSVPKPQEQKEPANTDTKPEKQSKQPTKNQAPPLISNVPAEDKTQSNQTTTDDKELSTVERELRGIEEILDRLEGKKPKERPPLVIAPKDEPTESPSTTGDVDSQTQTQNLPPANTQEVRVDSQEDISHSQHDEVLPLDLSELIIEIERLEPATKKATTGPAKHSRSLIGSGRFSYFNNDYGNPNKPQTTKIIDDLERNWDLPGVQQRIAKRVSEPYGLRNFFKYAQPLVPYIEGIYSYYDVPPSLAYMFIIESQYFNDGQYQIEAAYGGKSSALGPGQFLTGTARHLGMKVGGATDERRFFATSACGKAKYLDELFDYFGQDDATLIILGYHIGPGATRNLRRKLPRNAIQKVSASTYTMASDYGFSFKKIAQYNLTKKDAIDYVYFVLADYFIGGNPLAYSEKLLPDTYATSLPKNMWGPNGQVHNRECQQVISTQGPI